MRIIIDTNRYRDFCEGAIEALEVVRRAERIYLPFVVLGELRAGFTVGRRGRENEQVLIRFLNKSRVELLYADENTTRFYAYLYKQLKTQATPIPVNDLWLSALAVQHDLFLFSRDSHFDHLPQIPRV